MYGDETQNELMALIKRHKEEGEESMENEIRKLEEDIESYKETIEDARIALDAAQMELNEALNSLVDS